MSMKINLKTKEDLDSLASFLHVIDGYYYKKGHVDFDSLEKQWGTFSWYKEVYKELNSIINNDNEYKLLISGYREGFKKYEIIKIYMGFRPSTGFIDRIYKVFSDLNKEPFVLDFIEDLSVHIGAKIAYKGLFLNLNVKKKIFEIVKSKYAVK